MQEALLAYKHYKATQIKAYAITFDKRSNS
jgi:hypothetical protein